MLCTHCHTNNPNNANYCYSCGKSLMQLGLRPVACNGKWGYVNENGDLIIPYKFDQAGEFNDGIASVTMIEDNMYYEDYINEEGEQIFGWHNIAEGEDLGAYSEGLIYLGNWYWCDYYNYCDKYGNIILNGNYSSATNFKNGLALVSFDRSLCDDRFCAQKWAFIDKTGNVVKKLDYTLIDSFSNGLAKVNKGASFIDVGENIASGWAGGLFGYINEKGEEIIPPQYTNATEFSEGYAAVKTELEVWIFIDTTGRRMSKRVYESIKCNSVYGFRNGYAPVCNYNKWGYIDIFGIEYIPIQFEEVTHFNDSGLATVMLNGMWGLIDCAGNTIVDFKYSEIKYCPIQNIYILSTNNQKGIISFDEWQSIDVMDVVFYDDLDLAQPDNEDSMLWIKNKGKWGLTTLSKKEILPCLYDKYSLFSDGYAWVCLNQKWGTIDIHGNNIIPFKYSGSGRPQPFRNGIASFFHFDPFKHVLIDYRGNEIDFCFNEIASEIFKIKQNDRPLYLFFDTETTGVPKDYKAPIADLNNWPRLVQLAWILCDENGKQLASYNQIIKPDGFNIPTDASNVHKITTDIAIAQGVDLSEALKQFVEVTQLANIIIVHNVGFDIKILGAELLRIHSDFQIMNKPSMCTMLSSVNYCAIPNNQNWGEKYKWPKLQELHKKLFGYEFDDAHDAMADIQATQKCFFEMIKRKIIYHPKK